MFSAITHIASLFTLNNAMKWQIDKNHVVKLDTSWKSKQRLRLIKYLRLAD
jgi:hypothetical protein